MNPRVVLTREQVYRLLDGHPVQVPTAVGLLEVEAFPNEWVPLEKLDPTPPHMVDVHRQVGAAIEIEVWANGTYEVIVTRGGIYRKSTAEAEATEGGVTHLSIKRLDRAPIRNWRHMQQMKNEICGPEAEAVELYPAESRLADNANQFHLWVFPDNLRLPLGFNQLLVTSDEEVAAFNQAGHRGRQEPWEPGLTTGDGRNDPDKPPGDPGGLFT